MFYQNKIRLCFVGNPNVGKSTLINRILRVNKLKTDKYPGTTKEVFETPFDWQNNKFVLIDTAGVYKKKNIDYEVLSQTIDTADLIILVLEANLEKIDKVHRLLVDYSLKKGKGVIIIFNKWDLVIDKRKQKKKLIKFINFSLPQIDAGNIFFISALKDLKFSNILGFSTRLRVLFNQKIKTSYLNKWLRNTVKLNPPKKLKGREIKFKYIVQIKNFPPTFSIFSNHKKKVSLTYKKFLEKNLKLSFNFKNIPVFIKFSSSDNPYRK